MSDMFKPCHGVIRPTALIARCEADTCLQMDRRHDFTFKCKYMDTYAMMCAQEGVDVDWHTNETHKIQCGEFKLLLITNYITNM